MYLPLLGQRAEEKMIVVHKIEMRPTEDQANFLKRCCGVRRFIYNACLAEWKYAYSHGLAPDEDYMRFYLKLLQIRFPWIKEVPSRVHYTTIKSLTDAYIRFFKGKAKPPRFKKKGIQNSFTLDGPIFKIKGRKLRLPLLKSVIGIRERVRFEGEFRQCTVSGRAGKWFISVMVKTEGNPYTNKSPGPSKVGIDLGIKDMAVLSDGTIYPANQELKRKLEKLAILQRRLAKKKKGSKRAEQLKTKIARLHYYVSCKRSAVIHKFTDEVTRKHNHIVIEDLNVSGMVKNHRLARAVSDVSFYEIRRQLEYKALDRGGEITVADRFFPSSKLCSQCGCIKTDLTLSDRVYICDCGLTLNRDENAARNLLNYRPGQTQAGRKTVRKSRRVADCDDDANKPLI